MNASAETPVRRYRFQFSLRTLLLLTAVAAAACAWWVRPRWLEESEAGGAIRIAKRVRYDKDEVAQRHGAWIACNEQGRTLVEGAYLEPLATGHWTYHDSQGRKLLEGDCRRGQKEGVWTAWHSNGQKQSEVEYVNNVPHGTSTTWWQSGKLRSRGVCVAGQRVGPWSFHDEQGTLRSQGEYVDGQEQGAWQSWNAAGRELAGRHFAEGRETRLEPALLAKLEHAVQGSASADASDALWSAARLAPQNPGILIAGLQHRDPQVRSRAAIYLQQLGPAAPEAIEPLITALDDPVPLVCANAALALGRHGEAAQAALPKLRVLANQETNNLQSEWQRRPFSAVIVLISPADLPTLRAFVRAIPANPPGMSYDFQHNHQDWREQPALIASLEQLLTDRDTDVAQRAAVLLGVFRPHAIQVLPLLLKTLEDPRPAVRIGACQGLKMLGTSARPAYPRLEAIATTDPDEAVRAAATAAQRTMQSMRADDRDQGHGGLGNGFF